MIENFFFLLTPTLRGFALCRKLEIKIKRKKEISSIQRNINHFLMNTVESICNESWFPLANCSTRQALSNELCWTLLLGKSCRMWMSVIPTTKLLRCYLAAFIPLVFIFNLHMEWSIDSCSPLNFKAQICHQWLKVPQY